MSAHSRPQRNSEKVRIIPAGEFKAKCLQLMDDVAETGQPITVTKRGKPVGRFVPIVEEEKPFRSIFGRTSGRAAAESAALQSEEAAWGAAWEASTRRLERQIRGDFSEDR